MAGNAHSLLGASAAHRWLACPGSFHLSQVAPHRPSSVYAAMGTAAHAYIEQAANTGLQPLGPEEIGKSWHVDGYIGTVDQTFIDGINVMVKYLHETAIQGGADFLAIEKQVSLDSYFSSRSPVSLFGTTDAVMGWWGGMLEIVDYKNGAGVAVQPAWNPQMMFYAAGAVAEIPPPPKGWNCIRLTIVQPHAGGEPVRSWDLAPIDLLMWLDEVLIPGVRACEDPDAPLNAGSWCRFCPVSQHCPLLHEAAQNAAKAEFDEIPDDGTALAEQLEQAERAERWIAAVREIALEQLQRQVRIPGWELQPTRPTRKWVKPDDDIAAALRNAGANAQTIWETRLRSPASLEKVLNRTREGRLLWAAEVEGQRLFERRSSGVKIGRAGATAQEDFADE